MKLYNEPGITRVSSEFRHQTPCLGLASSRQRSPTAGRALPAVRWCGGQRAERPRLSLEPQGPDETWWNHGVPRKNPKSGMVFNGKSQTKMDDDWGYPYFVVKSLREILMNNMTNMWSFLGQHRHATSKRLNVLIYHRSRAVPWIVSHCSWFELVKIVGYNMI